MPQQSIKSIVQAKQAAGRAAIKYVTDGMIIGLGTGSTTKYFIEALGKYCEKGLKIQAISSSEETTRFAKKLHIPLLEADQIDHIDLTIDGADEIDPWKRMIKGGGGALLREKILASISKELIIVVDETKCVPQLGRGPLAIEIAQFGQSAVLKKIHSLHASFRPKLRLKADGSPYTTDNGNRIVDLFFSEPIEDPVELDREIKTIVGVLETGLFIGLAERVLIGSADGHVEERK